MGERVPPSGSLAKWWMPGMVSRRRNALLLPGAPAISSSASVPQQPPMPFVPTCSRLPTWVATIKGRQQCPNLDRTARTQKTRKASAQQDPPHRNRRALQSGPQHAHTQHPHDHDQEKALSLIWQAHIKRGSVEKFTYMRPERHGGATMPLCATFWNDSRSSMQGGTLLSNSLRSRW